MDTKKKYTLHYGGETFDLGDSHGDLLDEYRGEAGTIKLNLGARGRLTIAIGPGIPIALTERDVKAGRVARIV